MDWYHIWCDLRPGEDDLAFCKKITMPILGIWRGTV